MILKERIIALSRQYGGILLKALMKREKFSQDGAMSQSRIDTSVSQISEKIVTVAPAASVP
jgi:hypothetical protein